MAMSEQNALGSEQSPAGRTPLLLRTGAEITGEGRAVFRHSYSVLITVKSPR